MWSREQTLGLVLLLLGFVLCLIFSWFILQQKPLPLHWGHRSVRQPEHERRPEVIVQEVELPQPVKEEERKAEIRADILIGSQEWSRDVRYSREDTDSLVPSDFKWCIEPEGYLWVRSGSRPRSDLDTLMEQIRSGWSRRFVLVSSDGDRPIPNGLTPSTWSDLVKSPWVIAWYTQNLDTTLLSPEERLKVRPLPIGLDYHTLAGVWPTREARDEAWLRTVARPAETRSPKVWCDVHWAIRGPSRLYLEQNMSRYPTLVTSPHRFGFEDTWHAYKTHEWVLSLPGGGWDCHRTYEALALGAKVVTIRSPLDDLFRKIGGVLILDSLDDLEDEAVLQRPTPPLRPEWLWRETWVAEFRTLSQN